MGGGQMVIADLRLRRCAAELTGPMRSRGDVGYREFFHTGSERQRLDGVEVVAGGGGGGVAVGGGGAAEGPRFLEQVALPALRGEAPGAVASLRARLWEGARAAGDPVARVARGIINRLEFALYDLA